MCVCVFVCLWLVCLLVCVCAHPCPCSCLCLCLCVCMAVCMLCVCVRPSLSRGCGLHPSPTANSLVNCDNIRHEFAVTAWPCPTKFYLTKMSGVMPHNAAAPLAGSDQRPPLCARLQDRNQLQGPSAAQSGTPARI